MIQFPTRLLTPKQQAKVDKNTELLRARKQRQSPEAKQAATDFIKFREYVCGHKTYPHMLEWIAVLNTGESNKYLKGITGEDTCILAPRNSAKSSVLLQWVAWNIGVHINLGLSLKILYISYTIEVAASKSRQIKAILESKPYQEVFPKIQPSKSKWGEREWAIDFNHAGVSVIEEPYTLACSGLKGSVNGKRAHCIISDDVVKSPSEGRNKLIQEKLEENWLQIVRFVKFDGSRTICLGTRMAKHDVYTRIFIPPQWRVITQSAIVVENGEEKSFWEPERPEAPGLSLTTLQQEREEDLESFLLQRQNQIPEESFQGIRPHLIKFGWLPLEFERLVIGVDLASSSRGDYTAFTTIGISQNKVYVCSSYQERLLGNMKTIDQLFDQWSTWADKCLNPPILAVDANRYAMDFQGDLLDYLQELEGSTESEEKFKHLQIDPIKSSGRGEKIDRLMGHSLLFEKGRIYFNRVSSDDGKSYMDKLIHQITDFNVMDSNDLMDALEMALLIGRNYINSEITVAG
ncbi:hypothetical protein HW132_30910 [Brasilonema sp. CT11]|nr:hypothetical protein [Brasilonema sp. CT11]